MKRARDIQNSRRLRSNRQSLRLAGLKVHARNHSQRPSQDGIDIDRYFKTMPGYDTGENGRSASACQC